MRLYPVERGLNPPLQGLPALDTCLDSLFSCFGKFCFPGPLSRQLYRCPKQPTKTGGTRNSCLDRCSEQGETHQGAHGTRCQALIVLTCIFTRDVGAVEACSSRSLACGRPANRARPSVHLGVLHIMHARSASQFWLGSSCCHQSLRFHHINHVFMIFHTKVICTPVIVFLYCRLSVVAEGLYDILDTDAQQGLGYQQGPSTPIEIVTTGGHLEQITLISALTLPCLRCRSFPIGAMV